MNMNIWTVFAIIGKANDNTHMCTHTQTHTQTQTQTHRHTQTHTHRHTHIDKLYTYTSTHRPQKLIIMLQEADKHNSRQLIFDISLKLGF